MEQHIVTIVETEPGPSCRIGSSCSASSWRLSSWQLQRVPSVQDLDKSRADVRCNPGRNSPATTAVRIGQGWRRNITSINIAAAAHSSIFTMSIIATSNNYFGASRTTLYIYISIPSARHRSKLEKTLLRQVALMLFRITLAIFGCQATTEPSKLNPFPLLLNPP